MKLWDSKINVFCFYLRLTQCPNFFRIRVACHKILISFFVIVHPDEKDLLCGTQHLGDHLPHSAETVTAEKCCNRKMHAWWILWFEFIKNPHVELWLWLILHKPLINAYDVLAFLNKESVWNVAKRGRMIQTERDELPEGRISGIQVASATVFHVTMTIIIKIHKGQQQKVRQVLRNQLNGRNNI